MKHRKTTGVCLSLYDYTARVAIPDSEVVCAYAINKTISMQLSSNEVFITVTGATTTVSQRNKTG